MKSINLVIKNDERHCMPHLYIHATLYSMHRLVVPSGNENLRGSFIDDVSSFEISESVLSETNVYHCQAKTIFHENSHFSSFKMHDENWESKQQCMPNLSIGSDSYF